MLCEKFQASANKYVVIQRAWSGVGRCGTAIVDVVSNCGVMRSDRFASFGVETGECGRCVAILHSQ